MLTFVTTRPVKTGQPHQIKEQQRNVLVHWTTNIPLIIGFLVNLAALQFFLRADFPTFEL